MRCDLLFSVSRHFFHCHDTTPFGTQSLHLALCVFIWHPKSPFGTLHLHLTPCNFRKLLMTIAFLAKTRTCFGCNHRQIFVANTLFYLVINMGRGSSIEEGRRIVAKLLGSDQIRISWYADYKCFIQLRFLNRTSILQCRFPAARPTLLIWQSRQ